MAKTTPQQVIKETDLDSYIIDGIDGKDKVSIIVDMMGHGWSDHEGIPSKNVKNRGYPDREDVDQETWSMIVQDQIDALSDEFDGFQVTGRMGGWWGIDISDDDFEINTKVLLPIIEKLIKEAEIKLKDKEDLDSVDIAEYVVDNIGDYTIDMIKPTKETITKFNKFDNDMESIIKTLETNSYWDEFVEKEEK